MKNNKSFQSKRIFTKKSIPVLNFATLFNSGLIENSWILILAGMQKEIHVVLVETYKEKLIFFFSFSKWRIILIMFQIIVDIFDITPKLTAHM